MRILKWKMYGWEKNREKNLLNSFIFFFFVFHEWKANKQGTYQPANGVNKKWCAWKFYTYFRVNSQNKYKTKVREEKNDECVERTSLYNLDFFSKKKIRKNSRGKRF